MTKTDKTELPALTLEGRCFHTFDAGGFVQTQGVVRGNLGNGFYLVQYFDWIVGNPGTMEVRSVHDMMPGRGADCWQFYEDADHMNFWYKHHALKRDKTDAA